MPNGDTPQKMTPQQFAAKIKAKYPVYVSMPDDQLVSKITEKYPQYKAQIFGSSYPIESKSTIGPAKQPPIASVSGIPGVTGPGAFDINTTGIENYTQEGRKEHPVLSRVGDVTKSLKELMLGGKRAGKPMGTDTGVLNNPVLQAITMAPGLEETAASVTGKISEAMKPGELLARVNKILGVGPREIRVGQLPSELSEFASNPARGVLKAGMNERQLAKMNPLERVKSLTGVRDAAGAKLDQVLQAAGNKTINVQKVVEDVFKEIPDPKMVKLATTRVQQILAKAKIAKPLSQLNPMEARTVQRALDDFANFSPEGQTKSFSDIATALRRGISKATRQAIPETAELDQDYGDLAGAVKAARNQANKYARTVPESKLRKMIPWLVAGAAGAGAGKAVQHLIPSSP